MHGKLFFFSEVIDIFEDFFGGTLAEATIVEIIQERVFFVQRRSTLSRSSRASCVSLVTRLKFSRSGSRFTILLSNSRVRTQRSALIRCSHKSLHFQSKLPTEFGRGRLSTMQNVSDSFSFKVQLISKLHYIWILTATRRQPTTRSGDFLVASKVASIAPQPSLLLLHSVSWALCI